MSNDERPESLAAQAAAWVPPWERQQREPDRDFQAAAEEAARAEAEEAARRQAGGQDVSESEEEAAAVGVEGRDFAEAEELAAADDLVDADDTEAGGDETDEPFVRPDDDEDRSEAGLSDDDDDFDAAFEGPNPPGYQALDGLRSSLDPGRHYEAVAVDSPAGADEPVEPEPTTAEVGPDLPVPEAIEEAAEDADDSDGQPADAPLPVDAGDVFEAAADDDVSDDGELDVPVVEEVPAETAGAAVPEQGRGPEPAPAQDALLARSEAGELPALMEDAELAAALEAIMLVVDEPVGEMQLAQILEQPTERVGAMLEDLSARYTAAGHGFDLRRVAGGWRLYTRPQYAAYVERFVLDGQSVRLTQAALETLAVVAYKQPVTRSRISAIRGVNCDGVMRTLVTRGLIEECGTEGETGAYLYRTTALFLEKLGLNSVDQLPPLAPFLPDDVEEVLDAPG